MQKKNAKPALYFGFVASLIVSCAVFYSSCSPRRSGSNPAPVATTDPTPSTTPAATVTSVVTPVPTVSSASGFVITAQLQAGDLFSLLPSYAVLDANGLRGQLQAVIYRKDITATQQNLITTALNLSVVIPNDASSRFNFARRMDLFLVKYQGDRTVNSTVNNTAGAPSTISTTDGSVLLTFNNTATRDPNPAIDETSAPVPITINATPGTYSPVGEPILEAIPSRGVSVVSDIDDTIKVTNVGDRMKLLRSVFLETYNAIPNVANWMRSMRDTCHASFHYVTESPDQLASEISEFLGRSNLPRGSFHFSKLRVSGPSFLDFFVLNSSEKNVKIDAILRDFPNRRFVLIGDTGQKDPETYTLLAKNYSAQVKKIFLRVPSGGVSSQQSRVNSLMSGLNIPVVLFDDSASTIDSSCP